VLTGRLYGMMQQLMAAYAQQQAPEAGPRSVVELQDALDAVIQLAAVIDEETQAGRIPAVRGQHAAAMLMLEREYIQPLPRGLDADGITDNLTTDLGAMVMALREARWPPGTRVNQPPVGSSHGEIRPEAQLIQAAVREPHRGGASRPRHPGRRWYTGAQTSGCRRPRIWAV